jgi:hypothetical protein
MRKNKLQDIISSKTKQKKFCILVYNSASPPLPKGGGNEKEKKKALVVGKEKGKHNLRHTRHHHVPKKGIQTQVKQQKEKVAKNQREKGKVQNNACKTPKSKSQRK